MIVTLTKKGFHSFPPARTFPIRNIPLVPFVRDGSNDSWKYNFTSNNLLTVIHPRWTTRAHGGTSYIYIYTYVRVHVFGKKGMKRHEKKGWLGAYYEQRARGTSVPSIFHVHPCNKKIYTSLEKMGCRRCDVWILVQCRASGMHGGDVAPHRAGKWNPIIVRTPWIVARPMESE